MTDKLLAARYPEFSTTAHDYACKLGLAEGYLTHIVAVAEHPGLDLAATLREIATCAKDALDRTRGEDHDAG